MQMCSNEKHIKFVWKQESTINRTDRIHDALFFYENKVFKNVEAQNLWMI